MRHRLTEWDVAARMRGKNKMGKALYFECCSGISGDMTVAALIDLGADRNKLEQVLRTIPVQGFRTEISRVIKSGLNACDFNVILKEDNHDHDMEYLYGTDHHTHEDYHAHDYQTHEHHTHDHYIHDHHTHDCSAQDHHTHNHHTHDGHTHCEHAQGGNVHSTHAHHHEGHHEHRGLPEIIDVIRHTEMSENARDIAISIFKILADAEAKAHGVPAERVHFHEVGAVDSIVDIIAAAVCLDDLGVKEVIVPELYEGTGMIRCQHGMIPVPVPAVTNIAESYGLKFHMTSVKGELVTPTGAAIVAAARTSDKLPEEFTILKTGLGAGKRNYELPGILRVMLIEYSGKAEKTANYRLYDTIYRLESNIDDCSGENLGYVMEKLLKAGARDVNYIPVYMKKNRPAYQLNVICDKEDVSRLENIIFQETTTIGIRKMEMERTVLKREMRYVETSLGMAEVKICTLPDGGIRCYPEYSSVSKLAEKNHISYQETYEKIRKEFAEQY